MRAHQAWLLASIAACGGGHPGAPPDAPLPPCDFAEASDGTNAIAPEITNVEIGNETRNLCGTVDVGHFDVGTGVVDVDVYRVTVSPATADLVVQFFGGAGVTALTDLSVLVFDTQAPNPTLLNGAHADPAKTNHGVFVATLPVGTYDVIVTASAPKALSAPFDYKVRIGVEERAATCAIATTPADYVEAHDGADSHGNDVLLVDFANHPAFRATGGSAEPTGLTIDASRNLHIRGTSAQVPAGADQYLDRDTYEIRTSASANELVVRLAWVGGAADLDEVVVADPAAPPVELGYSTSSGTDGATGELARIAVEPSSSYLFWIGATTSSTGTPTSYDLAVCGVTVDTSVAR
jgi:hypothetical protein